MIAMQRIVIIAIITCISLIVNVVFIVITSHPSLAGNTLHALDLIETILAIILLMNEIKVRLKLVLCAEWRSDHQ